MIQKSFLAHADKRPTFLKNLRYIVVDEMHEYRGYFGSNMSLLLRRLTHHLRTIGSTPQYFLASATCANAREHAGNLTGLSFEEANAADQLRPRRSYYFVKPDIPAFQYWGVLQLRTVNAGSSCSGIQRPRSPYGSPRLVAPFSRSTSRSSPYASVGSCSLPGGGVPPVSAESRRRLPVAAAPMPPPL